MQQDDEYRWFAPSVKPTAPVAEYAAAPPRGMTNPPLSDKVRERLLEDLDDYAINLDPKSSWPPPLLAQPSRHPVIKAATQVGWRKTPWVGMPSLECRQHLEAAAFKEKGRTKSEAAVHRTAPAERAKEAEIGAVHAQRPNSEKGRHRHAGAKEASGPSGDQPKESDDPFAVQKQVRKDISDIELNNSLETLKGQGRLHRAWVSDQFRFGADLSVGGSMVIKGAGASANVPGVWASYASHLNKFHNKAMRTVNPSKLEVLPDEDKPRKKKKDEDEIQLSKSGLFQPKYKADAAYRTLRQLRRSMNVEKEEDIHPRELPSKPVMGSMSMALLFNKDKDND